MPPPSDPQPTERDRRGGRSPEPPAGGSAQYAGPYEILGEIGRGGMGTVYKARHGQLGRFAALKFLPADLAADEQAKERFLAEARAAAALDHPNVCTVHDIGETGDGDLFIAMAFCEGETLRARIARGPLSIEDAVDVARQVAKGLVAAHERGIVHRDIKPANVMVAEGGAVKVVDFGIAKVSGLDLTRESTTLGTTAYMSPEQARGEPVDPRTDIWSLGVLLYEMLAGERPFAAPYEQAVLFQLLHESPAPLASRRPDVPPALAQVVERALAKVPDQRYPSLDALLQDLDALDAPRGPTRAPEAAPQPTAQRPSSTPGASTASGPPTAALLPEGERRQATVVASYLNGYTSLVEQLPRDEVAQVTARLRADAEEVAQRYGGLVNACGGDEVVMLFGIPVTHEDDAVRAVRAARDLHAHVRDLGDEVAPRTGQPLRLCTGLDTGLVAVQHASGHDQTYRLAGSPPQAAGTLSGQAEPDEILTTPECHRLVAPFFDTEAGLPTRLKGRSAPVTPYRVGEALAQDRLGIDEDARLTSYAGRAKELARLNRLLERAVAGEGQFVAVVGEAGMGKSRFLREFRRGLPPDVTRLLLGRCQSYGVSIPYLPFIDALRDTLGLHDGDAQDRSAEQVAQRIRAVSPDLEVFLPIYLHLLSIPSSVYPLPDDLDGGQLRLAIQEALAALFTLHAADGPVVMLFEDWHWADDASRAALAPLVEVAAAYPLLILVTYRPGYDVAWSVPALPTPIHLEPLDLEASLTLLGSVFGGGRFSEDTGQLLHERTGGNPFFLEEIARTLSEEGALRVEGTRVTAARSLGDADLPGTVQAVIRTRLHRMPAAAQSVVRVAAVVGREFTRGVLEHVLEDAAALQPALAVLRSADLIQQTRVLPEAAYRFKHALTREVAYDSLLAHQRKTLHGRVGAAVEALHADRLDEQAELLAQHFSQAESWEEAVTYGLAAAHKANSLSQFPEALRMYEHAQRWLLRQPESPERRDAHIDVLLLLEQVCERMGLRERQQAAIAEGLVLVERGGLAAQRAALLQRQGDLLTLLGRYTEAERPLEEACRLRRDLGDEAGERSVARSLGMLCWHADRLEEAVEHIEGALEIDRRRGDDDAVIGDLHNLGSVLKRVGRLDEAIGHLREAQDLAESLNSHRLSYVLHTLAGTHVARGDFETAETLFHRVIDVMTESGLAYHKLSYPLLSLGNLCWEQGDVEESLAWYRKAIAYSRPGRDPEGLALSLRAAGDLLVWAERYDEALPYLTDAAVQFETLLDPRAAANVWVSVATCDERLGDDAAAVTAWSRARALLERESDENGELKALEGLAQATRRLGADVAATRELFDEALERAHRLGDREAEGRLHNAAGIFEWEQGAFGSALPHFQAALMGFQALGDPVHQALMLNSIGVTLRKLGRLDEAVVCLEEGAATARHAGQVLLEGHALASLGEISYDRGRYDEARASFERSLDLRRDANDRRGEGWMLYHLARTNGDLGETALAHEQTAEALEVAREQGDTDLAAACQNLLAP